MTTPRLPSMPPMPAWRDGPAGTRIAGHSGPFSVLTSDGRPAEISAEVDGVLVAELGPQGRLVLQPDRSAALHRPDGSVSRWDSQGRYLGTIPPTPPSEAAPPPAPTEEFHTTNVLNPDGTTTSRHPDGTLDVSAPDGSCWRLSPDGRLVASWHQAPNPSWHPPRDVIGRQPDGTNVVFHPDGTKDLWRDGRHLARFASNGQPA